MRVATLVPDPAVVALEQLVADDAGITVVLRARRAHACCPLCGQAAARVHSWYRRRLRDLPWQGLAVRLHLRTRRWFCDNPRCERRIFAERLPTIALPHAQRTQRLAAILLVFGVAVGGAPGARLLAELGIAVSGDTLRRAVGAAALPDAETPRVLGVDDWSLKQGHTYGTVLVDLEAHRPVDLLPDRSAASLEAWLKAHPGVEIICRDRGGAYADGAARGAPDAVQVADRWHLFANLGDMLERLLARYPAALGQVRLVEPPALAGDAPDARGPACPDPAPSPPAPKPPTRAARERALRDARREARHAEIHALHRQGLGVRATARRLGINKRTVQKYLAAPSCPHPGPRPNRRRAITPHLPYLRERWEAGERRVAVLWAELRARGFPGAAPRVREAVAPWRRAARAARQAAAGAAPPRPEPPPAGRRCAPRQVAAWLVRAPDDLRPAQQTYLDALIAACPAIDVARALARDFVRLLRERDATGLAAWLVAAEACDVAEIRAFAAGIRRDQAAVAAALTSEWSSGQVEGQVNRLKLVKRQAYGRAGFALLRRRYLLAS